MDEQWLSCFLFTLFIILMENASFSLFFVLFLKLRPQQLKNYKKVLLSSKITQDQSRLFSTSNYLSSAVDYFYYLSSVRDGWFIL